MKTLTLVLTAIAIALSGAHYSFARQDAQKDQHPLDPTVSASVKNIVAHYLELKNALASDNSKDAAAAGKTLAGAVGTVDTSLLTVDQKRLFQDIEDDAREHAEHIGENAGNIDHQREHFVILSKDIYDLVKEFGAGQFLYRNFCSMYNDKKGAMWLSETKTIKNPYYGKQMPSCGSVKEELK